jgi:hypothetical protein
VICKAPSANGSPQPVRDCATNIHRTHTTERNITRINDGHWRMVISCALANDDFFWV